MGGQQAERPTEDGLKKNTEGTEQQANGLPKDVLTYSYRYDYEQEGQIHKQNGLFSYYSSAP